MPGLIGIAHRRTSHGASMTRGVDMGRVRRVSTYEGDGTRHARPTCAANSVSVTGSETVGVAKAQT